MVFKKQQWQFQGCFRLSISEWQEYYSNFTVIFSVIFDSNLQCFLSQGAESQNQDKGHSKLESAHALRADV